MNAYGFTAGPYQTNTYIISDGAETNARAFVVDPGMHAHQRVLDLVKEHSFEVEAIVLTHGHIDHTRDAGSLARHFGVPVYIHSADAFMLESGEGVSEQSRILFDAANMTPISDLRDLDGDSIELIGQTFNLFHAPGHSPGSVLIVAADFALVGDVIFRGSIGRTDLPQSDPAAMDATLRGPVWALDDAIPLLPGHGPTTVMRVERATNPYLRGMGEVV